VAVEFVQKLRIATDSIEKSVDKLSGGNQQKVVLSKCLFADADLLLLDEPTRGVDVGAKSEIHDIIRRLAEDGTSVAIFSSELEEVMSTCDRIFLLFGGTLVATVANGPDVDSAAILDLVTGGGSEQAS
jgi:ribose transport system ATP-binding protein